jgi:hypothetical protein
LALSGGLFAKSILVLDSKTFPTRGRYGPVGRIASTGRPTSPTPRPIDRTRARVKDQFAEEGVPKADKRKIVSDNGMRTFGLGA